MTKNERELAAIAIFEEWNARPSVDMVERIKYLLPERVTVELPSFLKNWGR